jgi:MinD-like ATPase involved in chromosome partitioning or flagellar assembly
MLFACWSVKGGSGTTVVAAALALVLAESSPEGVVLVDAAGDLPNVLGLEDPEGPGLADWLAADQATAEALDRLLVDVGPGLHLLPWLGGPPPGPGAAERLLEALARERRRVVVDCGSGGGAFALDVAAAATVSLLVLRPCYVGLRRALAAPIRPSGVVLVSEPGRSLRRADVEDVLGVPVRVEVPWHEGVARAVDAGLLTRGLPKPLARALREAA